MNCRLYLIPTLLGDGDYLRSIPRYNLQLIDSIRTFVVENEKSARKFIKTILPEKTIRTQHTNTEQIHIRRRIARIVKTF